MSMQNESGYRAPRKDLPAHLFFESWCEQTDDPLPNIPILQATREQLEYLLAEPVLDLGAISEVILDDLGATLQILRLIGEEYLGEEDRPIRIEECVASLNAEVWFAAVCSATLIEDGRTLDAWEHARRIGRCAEELAAREEALRPGEAQLVGLLHEVGRLPELLGWQSGVDGMEDVALGALLAEHWHLPGCVLDAVRAQGRWATLLASAHTRDQQQAETERITGRAGPWLLKSQAAESPGAKRPAPLHPGKGF
jgi:HD-like signal output (HDOD) protein